MDALHLTITDYQDDTRWRWVLSDARGRFLADHEVRLDPAAPELAGLRDPGGYLDFYQPARPVAAQLAALGDWIGRQVFGALGPALLDAAQSGTTPVRLAIPAAAPAARALLQRPFELARLEGPAGPTLTGLGLILIREPAGLPDGTRAKAEGAELRLLACFSLPDAANPLNLRRQRYQLQRLVERLARTRGRAVALRVIQYGATRETLERALEDAAGWDLIHLSGHGRRGELLLETADGATDHIDAADLARLLRPARGRLKLLILDACLSGASQGAARRRLGLDPARDQGAAAPPPGAPLAPTELPSLGEDLARALDCAVLAMRYPVGDELATDLSLALYDKLLDRGQPLPAALALALEKTLTDPGGPQVSDDLPLSPITPLLLGPRAAGLELKPPARTATTPDARLGLTGIDEPERFVGRLAPMLRATRALAPGSGRTAVLFHGMAGAGKTACARELAYRHERDRFTHHIWYDAPEEGREIATALGNLLRTIERRINPPENPGALALALHLDDPEPFRAYVLPRLTALLERESLLLILDNLEGLLSEAGDWRDPLWGDLLGTLLGHRGDSRVVLTSRRLPRDLAPGSRGLGTLAGSLAGRVQVEAIHALYLPESVLLARELPNLRRLFDDPPGRGLIFRTLRLLQGHPKLLELADPLARDRAALEQQVAAGEAAIAALPAGGDPEGQGGAGSLSLDAFFALTGQAWEGESAQTEAGFLAELHRWTAGVSAGLGPTARLLLGFLCRLEAEDRQPRVVQANWKDFLKRIAGETPDAAAALAEPGEGLTPALERLAAAGLVEVVRPVLGPEERAGIQALVEAQGLPEGMDLDGLLAAIRDEGTRWRIHPGVAEAVLAGLDPAVAAAVDQELGDYHLAVLFHGQENEAQSGGARILEAGRRGAPYLMRAGRWEEASRLLEQMIRRDQAPETLAFALPLLRRIVAATAGTERALIDAGVLAKTLWRAGRTAEAEPELRRVLAEAKSAGWYRLASAAAGDLLDLLLATGRNEEALRLADEMAAHTRAARLGPWNQLLDQGRRLQVLARMGRYKEVLAEVEALRGQMRALPEAGEAEEAVSPWNVREGLLDTGRNAAMQTERWGQALALNAEVLASQTARGAPGLALARTRFNDYGPLLRLERRDECRALLQVCRAVFEREQDVAMLGKVYSAQADLQDECGDRRGAVDLGQAALRGKYQAGDPEDCAISHHNLANYLERSGADPALVLAHRAAAAALWIQMGSGQLPLAIHNLARQDLPPHPPAFADLGAQVEGLEGVRFRDCFAALPATYPDGDAALAAVWDLVRAEQAGRGRGPR